MKFLLYNNNFKFKEKPTENAVKFEFINKMKVKDYSWMIEMDEKEFFEFIKQKLICFYMFWDHKDNVFFPGEEFITISWWREIQ